MTRKQIQDEYFEWLCDIVCENRFSKKDSFKQLLARLHDIPFVYTIPMDKNRAEDGISLRYRFTVSHGYPHSLECLSRPCSVLEMMVALAIHCEETIMDDPAFGNRTGQWFWKMIVNLGLGSMDNEHFDGQFVDDVIERLIYREYEADGRGGLFTVKNCDVDLRTVQIWYQLCWYLNSIT